MVYEFLFSCRLQVGQNCRAGHLRYFLIFSLMNNDIFAFSIKLIWLPLGFLNRNTADKVNRE